MVTPGYIRAGRRTWIDHSPVRVDYQPKAPGEMVDVLVENAEIARRR
jgi:hypothetical protein